MNADAGEPCDTQKKDEVRKKGFRPLRIWIPVLLLAVMALARFIPGMVENGPAMIWMVSAFGPFLAGAVIVIWWLTLSRARWSERVVGLLGLVSILALALALVHPSMRGPLVLVMTIPMAIAGFTVGVCLNRSTISFRRTQIGLALALVGASYSLLLQNYGTRGDFAFDLDYRWERTPEEIFLADRANRGSESSPGPKPIDEDFLNPEWPGFRGRDRDGIQTGVKFSDNWSTPPEEIWRVKVGPAWSSFAVSGNYFFTQEQRGEEEAVVCYLADSGQEVWASTVTSRFFEALGGLGPRATPTIAEGKVYALSAEGYLRCL